MSLVRCPGVDGEGCGSMFDPSTGRTRCNICRRDYERLNPEPERSEIPMTLAAHRNKALAEDIARRSIEAYERQRAAAEPQQPDPSPDDDIPSFNDLIRESSERQLTDRRAAAERLFGQPEPNTEEDDQ